MPPPLPRNRRERRSFVNWESEGKTSRPRPRLDVEGHDSDGPCRSYELDDDDDNLPFSRELRSLPVPATFILPKFRSAKGKATLRSTLTNIRHR